MFTKEWMVNNNLRVKIPIIIKIVAAAIVAGFQWNEGLLSNDETVWYSVILVIIVSSLGSELITFNGKYRNRSTKADLRSVQLSGIFLFTGWLL